MKTKLAKGLATGLFVLGIAGTAAADTIVSQGLGSSAYTASSSWNGHTPDLAFDGSFLTAWNSGTYPVGWIEVNLGQSTDITRVLLSVAQLPIQAFTVHEVWSSSSRIGGDTSGAVLSYTFAGITNTEQLLSVGFTTPVTAQYVQIRTTNSPSWVAWSECQVMAADPVPEPATVLLFGTGIAGIAGTRLRRKKQ